MAKPHCTTKKTRFQDETGKTYGSLTVIEEYPCDKHGIFWKCKCTCGAEIITGSGDLRRRGNRVHYGCKYCRTNTRGRSETIEYYCHQHIVQRCTNPNNREYRNYGGRGIVICQRWRDFGNFCEDMGLRPSPDLSIDRIDNNGHYSCGKCPECIANGWKMNCRWATQYEQTSNRRISKLITWNGETKTVGRWAKDLGMCPQTLQRRLEYNWPIGKALTQKSWRQVRREEGGRVSTHAPV